MRKIILLITLLIYPLIATAEPATLISMRIQPSAVATTLTFTLSRQTTGSIKYVPEKKQLWIDFANTKKRFDMQNAKLGGANVISISSVDMPNQGVRFVLVVANKVTWKTKYTKPSAGNEMAMLEVTIVSSPSFRGAAPSFRGLSAESSAVKRTNDKATTLDSADKPRNDELNNPRNDGAAAAVEADIFKLLAEQKNNIGRARLENQTKVTSAQKQRKFTIVIDAGHGGKDTGALGANGTREKTVVLGIAKRLAALINQTATMRAVLTRDGDYFVPLRQRMKLARKDEADLFVAIHADAYFEPNAKGASVYALSTRAATSEAARWLAQKDNYSELDGVEFNALKDRSTLLRSVLIDMAQTATIQDSLRLGNRVLDALDDISSLHYKHVEQAPFMVLRSPDIPSILIETGFISNPKEEKRLADPVYQDKLARAILIGLQSYR